MPTLSRYKIPPSHLISWTLNKSLTISWEKKNVSAKAILCKTKTKPKNTHWLNLMYLLIFFDSKAHFLCEKTDSVRVSEKISDA